ncbi:ornithine decarboxylase-like [Thalassophryne amazonica]|uniref:ornithine decarboxylase-like n=1 Tax=Thalassophryne amazonica TaxID=390379 RepID=UPI001471F6CB|nr:ornithine decarboxylase-like [Thalassophryne amazonica]
MSLFISSSNIRTYKSSAMSVSFQDKWDLHVLDNGETISDFIDRKITEIKSEGIEVPFLVGNLDTVLGNHHRWLHNMPWVRPFYAVKCNPNPTIIRMLSGLGTRFDCSTKNEIQLVLSLGGTPDNIIYAHPIKPQSHIKYAKTCGVEKMTFDNEEELLKISQIYTTAKLVLRIAVDDSKSLSRLSSKFGAKMSIVGKLLERARELGLEVIGVSFHAGCVCTDRMTYKKAIADARCVFDIANSVGFQMSLLDIGRGFTGRDDIELNFEQVSEVINAALDEYFPSDSGVQIIAEPGRYYMDTTFTLAVTIIGRKVVTDEGAEHTKSEDGKPEQQMMYFINDGIHGIGSCLIVDPAHGKYLSYPHRAVQHNKQIYKSVIWGPTCNSNDKLTDNSWLPELQVGDWLLVDNMGAYTISLVTEFNGFEKANICTVVTAKTWQTLNLSYTKEKVAEEESKETKASAVRWEAEPPPYKRHDRGKTAGQFVLGTLEEDRGMDVEGLRVQGGVQEKGESKPSPVPRGRLKTIPSHHKSADWTLSGQKGSAEWYQRFSDTLDLARKDNEELAEQLRLVEERRQKYWDAEERRKLQQSTPNQGNHTKEPPTRRISAEVTIESAREVRLRQRQQRTAKEIAALEQDITGLLGRLRAVSSTRSGRNYGAPAGIEEDEEDSMCPLVKT